MEHKTVHPFRLARLAAGVSQEEIANEIGVTRWTIIRWERGRTRPAEANLKAAANALRVPVEALR